MSRRKKPHAAPRIEAPEPAIQELEAILERATVGPISAEEYAALKAVIATYALLKGELQSKTTSIERLKRMLFGASTEKTREVLREAPASTPQGLAAAEGRSGAAGQQASDSPDPGSGKRKGHGRNGAAVYTGAEKLEIAHRSLHGGDACPGSRMVQPRAESSADVALDTRLARDWGLKPDEWARYRRLMEGPLGIWSPHLDPLTALGIEARSQAERERYADLEVRVEGERVARILAYQRAYDAAWKRLYPHLEPVEFAATPRARPQVAEVSASRRLAVFVKEPCPPCDATVKALEAQGRSFDIYMVGLEDDAQLRAWATHVGLDTARVRAGAITLNHDDGRWLAVGDGSPLPAVLGQVNGQWQRE